jgi:hypothetical protein
LYAHSAHKCKLKKIKSKRPIIKCSSTTNAIKTKWADKIGCLN